VFEVSGRDVDTRWSEMIPEPLGSSRTVCAWRREQALIATTSGIAVAVGVTVVAGSLFGETLFAICSGAAYAGMKGTRRNTRPATQLPSGTRVESLLHTFSRVVLGAMLPLLVLDAAGLLNVVFAALGGGVALTRSLRFALHRRQLIRAERTRHVRLFRAVPERWYINKPSPLVLYYTDIR
jgi:hypothetical protein